VPAAGPPPVPGWFLAPPLAEPRPGNPCLHFPLTFAFPFPPLMLFFSLAPKGPFFFSPPPGLSSGAGVHPLVDLVFFSQTLCLPLFLSHVVVLFFAGTSRAICPCSFSPNSCFVLPGFSRVSPSSVGISFPRSPSVASLFFFSLFFLPQAFKWPWWAAFFWFCDFSLAGDKPPTCPPFYLHRSTSFGTPLPGPFPVVSSRLFRLPNTLARSSFPLFGALFCIFCSFSSLSPFVHFALNYAASALHFPPWLPFFFHSGLSGRAPVTLR